MNSLLKYIAIFIAFNTILTSCKKDDNNQVEEDNSGTVEVVFVPMRGASPLKMNESFTTPAGEEFTINDMKFFVSSVAVVQKDAKEIVAKPFADDSSQIGTWLIDFTKPNFDAGYGNQSFKFKFKAPEGDYADLRFSVSVPREYNLADISKNPYPLNGSNGMYWSWNSGFKFFVINGTSPAVSGSGAVHLSIGQGFRNIDYNFRSMLLAAQRPGIVVEKGKTTRIIYTYDVNKLLTNVNGAPYSFVTSPGSQSKSQVHGGEMSSVLQQNAAGAIDLLDFYISQ
jgi:hypothetical protein